MELIAELVALWQTQLLAAGLVFLRVGAMMALLPAFGERSVPARIRLVITLMFTVLVAPAVSDRYPAFEHLEDLVRTAGIEVLAGLAIGILLRLMMLVLQMAGTIAANATRLHRSLAAVHLIHNPQCRTCSSLQVWRWRRFQGCT